MKKIISFITLLVISTAIAQDNGAVDSLFQVLNKKISQPQRVDTYVEISKAFIARDSVKSIHYARLAEDLAKEIEYPSGETAALYSIGDLFKKLSQYTRSKTFYRMGVELASDHGLLAQEASGYNSMGSICYYQAKYDSAIHYFTLSIDAFQRVGNKQKIAGSYNNIGVIYRLQGDYDNALKYFLKSLEIKKEVGYEKGIAISYNSIANVYFYRGDFGRALEYHFLALRLREKINDLPGIAKSNNNIGNVFQQREDFENATQYYIQALKINEELGDKREMGNLLNNIGLNFQAKRVFEEALQYYFESVKIRKEISDWHGLTTSYVNIGNIYYQQKEYAKALKYQFEALDIYQTRDFTGDKAFCLLAIGNIYKAEGNIIDARNYFKDAISISNETGYLEPIIDAANQLALLEYELGNYKLAYEAHLLHSQISDSLINEEQTKKMTRLESEYLFEKEKDSIAYFNQREKIELNAEIRKKGMIQYITLLVLGLVVVFLVLIYRFYRLKKKSNLQLIEKNTFISQALHEREALIKEIHHRVKNNLQIISSLLNIQSRLTEDKEAKMALSNMHSRVLAMSLVHQNLYNTNNVTHVYTDEYLYNLATAIDNTLNVDEVRFHTIIERIKIPSGLAVKVGLMTNELLTNTYKHAFPKGFEGEKHLSLEVKKIDGNLIIIVEDNGVGMANQPSNKSYGLQLIRSLIKSLDGRLDIQTADNTLFTLFIPLK